MDVDFERRLLRPTNGPRSLLASPGSPQRPPGATAAALAAANSHRSPIIGSTTRRSLFREPGGHNSPLTSPAKKERYGDRFIPTRSGNNWETNFSMISDEGVVGNKKSTRDASDGSKDFSLLVYNSLLKNEILGTGIEDFKEAAAHSNAQNGIAGGETGGVGGSGVGGGMDAVRRAGGAGAGGVIPGGPAGSHGGAIGGGGVGGAGTPGGNVVAAMMSSPSNNENRNLYTFKTRRTNVINELTSPYSLTPVSAKSQKLLRSPRKASRKISGIPFKVLDAPELQDDFYLNLVDWSAQNVLSVGLGSCVYLWSACTSQVTKLCDLTSDNDSVTSVSWSERGNFVAVGTGRGYVQVWDVTASKKVNTLDGHTARVGALAWNGDSLSSGSRDRMILQRDVRTPALMPERRLVGHGQEVCGLKWSPDNQWLASGGNDNKLFVWSSQGSGSANPPGTTTPAGHMSPVHSFTDHSAAVKAIAWSPHHHGLLASGGGTADRCIRFWNTLTGQPMQSVDTGSQVCNLAWSKHASELVSTHGYSQNQILVWKYPSLVQVAKLTGHSYRVLYLAMSPDGEAIVTGAGDETLRFWNVFSKARSQKEAKSALNLFTSIR